MLPTSRVSSPSEGTTGQESLQGCITPLPLVGGREGCSPKVTRLPTPEMGVLPATSQHAPEPVGQESGLHSFIQRVFILTECPPFWGPGACQETM